MNNITFEDFKKVEIRMGKIISCEKVENADKLLKLQVDFGPAKQDSPGEQNSEERMIRQIVSGIAQSFAPEDLVGKTLPFIVNLEYRKFKGEESQGMLMAIDSGDKTILLEPSSEVPAGSEVV
jgi:methionine--tRNA ligase beta chain